MNDDNNSEITIDIPLPSEDLKLYAGDAEIEVEEVQQREGYFSVDHRRC